MPVKLSEITDRIMSAAARVPAVSPVPAIRAFPRYPVRRGALAVLIGTLGVGACYSRTQVVGYGFCTQYPPDTVPLPPIDIRASADSPGVVSVMAHIGRSIATAINAKVDGAFGSHQGDRVHFSAVSAGPHRLSAIVIGYRSRDTLLTVPRDSSLFVDVPVSRGGYSYCEDGEYEQKMPWWKFW